MKYQEIVDGDWDYLIILDACRYDDFKELYSRYLNGKLKKRLSRGSSTPEWLVKTFPEGKYDMTYISANPFINSKGVSLSKLIDVGNYKSNWNAKDKFKTIIDLWEYGFEKEIGVVHPKTTTKEASKYLNKKKLIIHYMQPHRPYFISTNGKSKNNLLRKLVLEGKESKDNTGFIQQIKKFVFLTFRLNKIKAIFERKEYKSNLEITLNHLSHLIEEIPRGKKVVISSDHGEGFGERGVFNHPPETKTSFLVEVPWLEIDEGKKSKEKIKSKNKKEKKPKSKNTKKDEEKIKERLKSLGYME